MSTEIPQEVYEAFLAAQNAGKNETETVIDMLGAGAKYETIKKVLNECMVEAGMVSSKEDREALVEETMEDLDVSEEDDLESAVSQLVDGLNGVDEKKAMALIRAWARKQEPAVEVYKKPTTPRNPAIDNMYQMFVDNPRTTPAELSAYIEENGNKTMKSIEGFHQRTLKYFTKMADKYGL